MLAGYVDETPRQLVRDLLLERDAELERAADAIDHACGGAGEVLVVEGRAGIGKTALAQAVQEIASAHGIECQLARGDDVHRDFPYGVVGQLFEAPVHEAEEDIRNSLLEGAPAPAAAILGQVGRANSSFPALHALFWLTSNLAERAPLPLAVDDAHWADGRWLRCLYYLARRVHELPVVLLLTCRPAEPGAEPELLKRMATAGFYGSLPCRRGRRRVWCGGSSEAVVTMTSAAPAMPRPVGADIAAGVQPLALAHPVVREAIYADIPPGERALADARAGRVLAQAGAPAEETAVHLLASEPAGLAWAVQALIDAAGEALRKGDPSGAAVFERAPRGATDFRPDGRARARSRAGKGAGGALGCLRAPAFGAPGGAPRHDPRRDRDRVRARPDPCGSFSRSRSRCSSRSEQLTSTLTRVYQKLEIAGREELPSTLTPTPSASTSGSARAS